ncbi:uncharacterized protein ISCGN_020073 [Ixodes scapularis]
MAAKDAPVPALAAASLRSPAPFSFDDAGEWLLWLQQFEDYAFATGMHLAPDETRVRTLLYCMGPRARIILSSLMSDEEAYQSYAEVTHRLTSYFVHPINEVYESSRFHKRTQQPGETVDSFFTAFRNMVRKCNYPSPAVDDRLVRDRFVVGSADSRLSDKLCRTPRLSLDDALVQARQHEDAEREKHRLSLTAGQPTAHVDAATSRKPVQRAHGRDIRRDSGNSGNSVSRDRPESFRTSNVREASRSSQSAQCLFCGHEYHRRSDCPAAKAKSGKQKAATTEDRILQQLRLELTQEGSLAPHAQGPSFVGADLSGTQAKAIAVKAETKAAEARAVKDVAKAAKAKARATEAKTTLFPAHKRSLKMRKIQMLFKLPCPHQARRWTPSTGLLGHTRVPL